MFSSATTPQCIDPHVLIKQEPIGDAHGDDAFATAGARIDDAGDDEDEDDERDGGEDGETLTSTIKAEFAHRSPHLGNLGSDDEDDDSKLLHSAEGKKLSPKERRQLRNKVSARNFRVRRKEYIGHLESLVNAHSSEAKSLRKEVASLRKENESLVAELSKLKIDGNDAAPAIAPTPASMTSPYEEPMHVDNVLDNTPMLPSIGRSNSQRSIASLLQRDSSSLIPTRESFQKDINPWSAGSQFASDWPLSGMASPSASSGPFDFNLNQFTSVFALRTAEPFSPRFSEKELMGKTGAVIGSTSELQACLDTFDAFMGCVVGSSWHTTA